MEELADQYTATVVALKALAKQLRIRNAGKLVQAARGKVPGASLKLAQLSLQDNVGKQVLGPARKSTGKSTAEGPNERLQADLIDFSSNVRGLREKYALMLVDVYTREVRAKPLLNKKPETVNAATRESLPSLIEDNTNFALTTDGGKEFSRLEEGGIPTQAVHRDKKAL